MCVFVVCMCGWRGRSDSKKQGEQGSWSECRDKKKKKGKERKPPITHTHAPLHCKQPRDGDGEREREIEKRVMVVVGMFWEQHKALVVVSICRIKTLALVEGG